MANISNEQPPQDVEEFLKEYLTRRFVEINIALGQSKKFPPINVIPAKPQAGNVEFFGRAIGAITSVGYWGYTGSAWVQLDSSGGGNIVDLDNGDAAEIYAVSDTTIESGGA